METLLDGKTVAVDGAIWFYEAQKQPDLLRIFGPVKAAVKVVFDRCNRWLRKGVLPVVVLEGAGGGRAERLGRGAGRLNATLAQPASEVKRLLAAIGVPCIDADGEAEAACAALAQCGACDFAASDDSDTLLFGAPRVLRSLELRDCAAKSSAELWELRRVEEVCGLGRNGLAAAASLIGCDYGAGVRGVGSRSALTTAQTLSGGMGEEACTLESLHSLLGEAAAAPEVPGTQSLRCVGCQRCGHGQVQKKKQGAKGCAECEAAAKQEGRSQLLALRRSQRTLQRAASDCSASQESVEGVAKQYGRAMDSGVQGALAQSPFSWKGVDEDAAKAALSGVVSAGDVGRRLLPLQLEWALRSIAEELPEVGALSQAELRRWAQRHDFPWVPVGAKRSGERLHAVVQWEPAFPGAPDLSSLPANVRHARLRLAEACKLLGKAVPRRPAGQMGIAQFMRPKEEAPEVCDDLPCTPPERLARPSPPSSPEKLPRKRACSARELSPDPKKCRKASARWASWVFSAVRETPPGQRTASGVEWACAGA